MIIGTRGSKLALAQAEKVRSALAARGISAELSVIKTSGDVQVDKPLHALQGYGAFVREIDEHLLNGDIDIAVHSLKDVPTKRPENIVTAAVFKRESALDVAVTRDGRLLSGLGDGAVIGTSSSRRSAMIRRHYPGYETKVIRGNVDTRLRKLREGEYDAILLAEAGLIRLGLDVKAERLDPTVFVPAANQGVICLATKPDGKAFEAARTLNDPITDLETRTERIIIAALDGGCVAPIGAYAKLEGAYLHVICEVLSLDGSRQARVDADIPIEEYEDGALDVADMVSFAGGKALVEEARKALKGDVHCD